jgi:hypothetical protein
MPTPPNRATQQDNFRKILLAIPKNLSRMSTILLAGEEFTPDTLVQFFQEQIALLDDATNTKALLAQKVAAIKANKTTRGPVLKAFNNFVLGCFETQPATLAEFTVVARKVPTVPANIKALAVAKHKATREARHTMGKRQREAVKGIVPEAILAVLAPAKATPATGVAPDVAPSGDVITSPGARTGTP